MPPCKGHKKSRAGCQVCKRRRIKCDESRPSCRNCARHGVRCDYAARVPDDSDSSSTSPASTLRQDSPQLAITARPLTTPSASASCSCNLSHSMRFPWPSDFPGALPACTLTTHLRNPPAPAPLAIADLNLLHHFTISTALTSSNHPDIHHVWSHTIPKLGETHPFVLHSILSAAAAHQNTAASIPLAQKHHSAALTLMRPHLTNINDSNCHALFAAASANTLYVLSRRDRAFSTAWTIGVRASFGILHQSWNWILRGPVAPFLHPYASPKRVSAATEAQLATLQRLCQDPTLPEPEELDDAVTAAAYFLAARNLRTVYAALEQSPIASDMMVSMMMQFVLRTPERFWECLQNRKGRALVLYAWFCVGWEGVGKWFTEGKAECDLGTVEGAMGPEWRPWVVGAREVLRGLKGGEVLIAREGVELEQGVSEGADDWIKEMLEMGMVGGDWR